MISSVADDFSIRHARPEDVEAYQALRLEALKNHPDAFGQDYDEALLKDHEYWEKTLTINPKEKALFLATKGIHLIGMAGIYRNLFKKSRHRATIWGVYVRPNFRGIRISETLVRACLGWAKEQQIIIVKLVVVTNNLPAVRCYERCGFTVYGTEPKAIFHDGSYYDEYLMSVEL